MIIPLITGPTAVGKTSVAIQLTLLAGGEIVSCDSRQLYAELNIGTARPSDAELDAVPHHFVAEISIRTPWSAGQFARAAEDRIAQIITRGHMPVVVGGSTLYIQALTEGLADIPPTDPAIRLALNEKLETVGSEKLFEALEHVDPAFAKTLDPTKSQRIVRGLEVYASTGRPLSDYFSESIAPLFRYRTFVLERDREILYERIDLRVTQMMSQGLLQEVHTLMEDGFDPETDLPRTIGYSELARFLRGEIDSLEEAVSLIKRNSRRYAKRQMTWFRSIEGAVVINIDEREANPKEIAQAILDQLPAA
ncbi:tRNA (adenosine(37)-N6)-dimethylallyltransferase MiaA [Rhodothermus sp. AH-315-K08]|nr:tRNA (adenosine(37)-N6)-dimethylallyltransferase MiaA [Rhodothermus sp. AH-315-K08]